jgi:CrcB protein
MKYALIVLFGGAGALARYLVGSAVEVRFGGRFPWGTLLVNVTGCFLIGLIVSLLTDRFVDPHPYWRLALVVGFLGGYTTFSSFELETFASIQVGGFWIGVANVMGSVGLGYAAVWLGAMLGRR